MKRVIHFHDVLSLYVSSAVRKTKEGILKNVGIKTYLVTIAFPFTEKKKHFAKYIHVLQKKESHTGLEWHEKNSFLGLIFL